MSAALKIPRTVKCENGTQRKRVNRCFKDFSPQAVTQFVFVACVRVCVVCEHVDTWRPEAYLGSLAVLHLIFLTGSSAEPGAQG